MPLAALKLMTVPLSSISLRIAGIVMPLAALKRLETVGTVTANMYCGHSNAACGIETCLRKVPQAQNRIAGIVMPLAALKHSHFFKWEMSNLKLRA